MTFLAIYCCIENYENSVAQSNNFILAVYVKKLKNDFINLNSVWHQFGRLTKAGGELDLEMALTLVTREIDYQLRAQLETGHITSIHKLSQNGGCF